MGRAALGLRVSLLAVLSWASDPVPTFPPHGAPPAAGVSGSAPCGPRTPPSRAAGQRRSWRQVSCLCIRGGAGGADADGAAEDRRWTYDAAGGPEPPPRVVEVEDDRDADSSGDEGADWVYEEVLERDPGNVDALAALGKIKHDTNGGAGQRGPLHAFPAPARVRARSWPRARGAGKGRRGGGRAERARACRGRGRGGAVLPAGARPPARPPARAAPARAPAPQLSRRPRQRAAPPRGCSALRAGLLHCRPPGEGPHPPHAHQPAALARAPPSRAGLAAPRGGQGRGLRRLRGARSSGGCG